MRAVGAAGVPNAGIERLVNAPDPLTFVRRPALIEAPDAAVNVAFSTDN